MSGLETASGFSPPRRRLLAGVVGAAALGLSGCSLRYLTMEEGWWNPCQTPLPADLAGHPLVREAWEGLEPRSVWDTHAHLVGTGDSGSGVWVNPELSSLRHPIQYARRRLYENAACAEAASGKVDDAVVSRLLELAQGLGGAKVLLLAFDWFHDEAGRPLPERSAFRVPNSYAAQVARAHPEVFEWAASIHPYRPDAVAALDAAARLGARAVKWLPQAQGIDPGSSKCDAFYTAVARLGLPLITHAGEEQAVAGGQIQHLGNPLRLRRPLEHGVRVVAAHCASLGQDVDLDKGEDGPEVESFALFARLMDDPRYAGKLYGDLSALIQLNRMEWLDRVVERQEWHGRLLNGSDYPLPGVMPIVSVDRFVERGWVRSAAAPVLKAVREHNPLLFDFVLKRTLRVNGRRLPAQVFETRQFFEPRETRSPR